MIRQLRELVNFKESTVPGDLVLIAAQDPEMLMYALVADIAPDTTRREAWWHVTLHLLSVPLQTVTWTLREPQFTGRESFTMGGKGRFIQAVQLPDKLPWGKETTQKKQPAPDKPGQSGLRLVK